MGLSSTLPPSLRLLHLWPEADQRELITNQPATEPTTPVWTPLPGPQTLAYESEADELFYGGAAGGGKTDLLLGLAGTQHRRSLILRRVFPEVRGIIERSREIYNAAGDPHSRDSYNEQLHIWRLANNTRLVEFGAIQLDKDKAKHRGRPKDFIGWDELPEFTESIYRFVNAWCRTTIPGQRCRVVGNGNPPIPGTPGEWVIHYWAPWLDEQHPNPAKAGELRWYARVDDEDVEREDGTPFTWKGETIYPRSRTFIPALLSDNPILEATGYRAMLQALPEPLRSMLLEGTFNLSLADDPFQVIPTAWVQAAQDRWTDQRPRLADGAPAPLDCTGVDVARGGKAATVLAKRYMNWVAELESHPGTATPDGQKVAALIATALTEGGVAHIDVIGVGTSAYDHARDVVGERAVAINVSVADSHRDKTGLLHFANLRTWAYWHLRELLDPASGYALALPPGAQLRADLCAPHYTVQMGKIVVEPKKDIAARLGRSPDEGDAVVLACLPVVAPGVAVEVLETLNAW